MFSSSSGVRSILTTRHEVVRIALLLCVVSLVFTSVAAGQIHGPLPADRAAVPQDQAKSSSIEQLPLGVPDQADTEPTSEASSSSGSRFDLAGLGKTAASLGLVIGLILALAFVFRFVSRRGPGIMAAMGPAGRAPAGVLEVLGRYPISRGQTLVLLKVDRRILILCQGSGGRLGTGLTTLSEIVDPEEVASILIKTRDDDGDSISDKFRSALHRFDPQETDPFDAQSSSRRTLVGTEGDVAELWDDKNGTVVDVSSARYGAIDSLKQRLAELRQREAGRS